MKTLQETIKNVLNGKVIKENISDKATDDYSLDFNVGVDNDLSEIYAEESLRNLGKIRGVLTGDDFSSNLIVLENDVDKELGYLIKLNLDGNLLDDFEEMENILTELYEFREISISELDYDSLEEAVFEEVINDSDMTSEDAEEFYDNKYDYTLSDLYAKFPDKLTNNDLKEFIETVIESLNAELSASYSTLEYIPDVISLLENDLSDVVETVGLDFNPEIHLGSIRGYSQGDHAFVAYLNEGDDKHIQQLVFDSPFYITDFEFAWEEGDFTIESYDIMDYVKDIYEYNVSEITSIIMNIVSDNDSFIVPSNFEDILKKELPKYPS